MRGYDAGGCVHEEVVDIGDANLYAKLVDDENFLLGFDIVERGFFHKDRQI